MKNRKIFPNTQYTFNQNKQEVTEIERVEQSSNFFEDDIPNLERKNYYFANQFQFDSADTKIDFFNVNLLAKL